jgi:hypothetical protein
VNPELLDPTTLDGLTARIAAGRSRDVVRAFRDAPRACWPSESAIPN